MSELIRTVNLHKSYYNGSEELPVLKGIDLSVQEGEILSVIGASGVGKSTLLHILGTLDRPTTGEVYYEGDNVFEFSDNQLDSFRSKNIGFIFQFHYLLSEFTAIENVAMGALIAGLNKDEAFSKARELLEYVGLADRLEHRPPKLSGGERQRVAVARALINKPKVILADEPTGNLDLKTSETIHELIWQLNSQINQTFIIVTHESYLAERADRVIHLVDGMLKDDDDSK